MTQPVKPLPEFRVALTRLKPGETVYPLEDGFAADGHEGQRTKLGGLPDYIQGDDDLPDCSSCSQPMIFHSAD